MIIPKKIKVGGQVYDITVEDRQSKHGVDRLGTTEVYKNRMWIDATQSQTQKESTLIHEIIEILDSLNEWKLEHKLISQLETGLYQALKDNNLLK